MQSQLSLYKFDEQEAGERNKETNHLRPTLGMWVLFNSFS